MRGEGNGNFTLMLRLNGAPVFGRGANVVPMEALEGRYVPGMHRRLVQSAAEAGMSLLRVWGGGVFPFEELLDACDDVGILIIQDMMYANIMAEATGEQEQELRDNVRRMAHHPSIAMYTGCNECAGAGSVRNRTPPVLNDFVLQTVVSEDDSRPIRAASPFSGYCTGVDTLTGYPNGRRLTSDFWPSCRPPSPTPQAPAAHPFVPEYHGPDAGGGGRRASVRLQRACLGPVERGE